MMTTHAEGTPNASAGRVKLNDGDDGGRESAMKVMDDAIDAVIVGSIGATSAAVRALSRGASYYLDAADSVRAKRRTTVTVIRG